MNEIHPERQAEFEICRYMVSALSAAGWSLVRINNGDGYEPVPQDLQERYEEIFAGDDCRLKFKNANGVLHVVYIVLGNSPDELICDFSYGTSPGDDFREVLEAVQEWAETYWQQRRGA